MKRLLTSAILAGILGTALLITTGAFAAVNCGGGVTVTGGTACRKAKSIVAEFKKTRKHHIQGFDCGGRKSGGRLVVVNCKLQNKKIHWEA